MRRAALVVLVGALLASAGIPAYAALPVEDAAPSPGLNCLQRVPLPELANVTYAAWSSDHVTLALQRFERRPSLDGYTEAEVLELLDLLTGKVRSLGTIDHGRPQWSASGRYLAYWGFKADFLEVWDNKAREVVAKVTPSFPDFRWAGDRLLYLEKRTIRGWTPGQPPQNLTLLGETKIPRYPEDDWRWSGDGSRFTLTRYDQRKPEVRRFIGATASGEPQPLDLPGALYTEWAPTGAILLVRYRTQLEVRDLTAGTTSRIAVAPNALTAWGPDGASLLVRTPGPSVVAGDAYEQARVVWPAAGAGTVALLPNVLGARGSSPDGRYFGGTVRTGRSDTIFAAFRCTELVYGDAAGVPVPAAERLASVDSGTGRLIRPVAGPVAQFFTLGHSGVDVAAPFASPIVASDDGAVTRTGWQDDDEGGYRVCLRHAAGLETCYYHVGAILVSVGQRVARGEVIALVGLSGRTTGPHVHWEAKLNGRVIDPLLR